MFTEPAHEHSYTLFCGHTDSMPYVCGIISFFRFGMFICTYRHRWCVYKIV